MKKAGLLNTVLFASFALGSLLLAIGCDLREVVEVERPYFKPPPEEAEGFLGYDEEDRKLTVCGNCHVGQQANWQLTAHADAWDGLVDSGHAQSFCENCHTVGPLGNIMDGEVGWVATGDDRYHDVQCESCHGPGDMHVSNPDAFKPNASLDVGDLTNLENATSCAQCHQGTHHPFAEEWAQSKHSNVVGFAAGREECAGCHRGQGALAAWGVKDEYIEKDSPDHLPITCGVCHDPHDNSNAGQLRFPVATTSIEENLCTQCHDRRTAPDPTSSHGLAPHAPETDLLLGDAGWFPPGVDIDQGEIFGSHGTQANTRLCATCHVNSFTVTDEATGEFVVNAVGHLFTAIPCVDGQGIPQTGDCGLAVTERSFKGCAGVGCHASEDDAATALASTSMSIQGYATQLFDMLMIVDPNLEESGGEIDPGEAAFTVAEGAFFNYNLATFGGGVVGSTTHNPFLVEALLIASISSVQETYGVTGNISPADLDKALEEIRQKVPATQPLSR